MKHSSNLVSYVFNAEVKKLYFTHELNKICSKCSQHLVCKICMQSSKLLQKTNSAFDGVTSTTNKSVLLTLHQVYRLLLLVFKYKYFILCLPLGHITELRGKRFGTLPLTSLFVTWWQRILNSAREPVRFRQVAATFTIGKRLPVWFTSYKFKYTEGD